MHVTLERFESSGNGEACEGVSKCGGKEMGREEWDEELSEGRTGLGKQLNCKKIKDNKKTWL